MLKFREIWILLYQKNEIKNLATSEAQYIESPGYGVSDYPGDLACRWTIANSGSGPLTLSFASPFWLETGYTHCYDTLTITDTNTGDTVTLCGDEVTL